MISTQPYPPWFGCYRRRFPPFCKQTAEFDILQGRPLHIRTVRTCVPFLAVTAHAHIGCTQWVNTWCTCTNTVQTRLPSHCLLVSLHARCHGAKTSTVTSRSPRTCQNAPYVGSKVIIMGTDVTVV